MGRKRFAFLDSMRGFAALWVVLFHLNVVGKFVPSTYQSFVSEGYLGVPIFFVLSGYAIHASVLRVPSIPNFLKRRFFRIYPPYLASVALVIGIVIFEKISTGTNDFITLPHELIEWLETLTLTTQPVTSTNPINWVYWTLSYEAAFYLWLTIGLLAPRLRWPILFIPVIFSLFHHSFPVFFIDHWCLFALGAAIAEWQQEKNPIAILLVILCLLDAMLHRTVGETVAASVAFVLVMMAISKRFNLLNREPILHKVGTWSYSLYLIHVPIGVWLALKIDPFPRSLSIGNLPFHIAIDVYALTVSCIFAYGFWHAIEKRSYEFALPHTVPASTHSAASEGHLT